MVHANPARIDGDMLTVDRKFHTGMLGFAEKIEAPLVTMHPRATDHAPIMDPVTVNLRDLPYGIRAASFGPDWQPTPEGIEQLRREVARARLVYAYGDGMGVPPIARECGVPYILMLEYDLMTEIAATATQVKNPLRRLVRAVRTAWHYRTVTLPAMRGAHSLHCNGFPMFDVAEGERLDALMYLDSRMSLDMMMTKELLYERLASRAGQPLRLLYSGRYEPLKGTLDVVRVGLECIARGIEIDMHCYGQGSLAIEMRRLADQSDCRIVIHDAVPYPRLVEIARTFDLFVCCHIQNDPSCTYLESFGAGLPIVGYANRMWQRLRDASDAGFSSPIGRPKLVAETIGRFRDHSLLMNKSVQALEYAHGHSHEREHGKRIEALNEAIAEGV